MEVKTNKEYQTMQHEIATAEEAVRSHEDRILERMEEAENLARDLKAAEAELKTPAGGRSRAERKALDAEAAALQTTADADLGGTHAPRPQELSPAALQAVRARREAAQGPRGRRSARRRLHGLPRPTCARRCSTRSAAAKR